MECIRHSNLGTQPSPMRLLDFSEIELVSGGVAVDGVRDILTGVAIGSAVIIGIAALPEVLAGAALYAAVVGLTGGSVAAGSFVAIGAAECGDVSSDHLQN